MYPGPEIRQAAERRLVRKLDFRLLLTIVIIFIMNYIDRVAITSLRLKGLESDLGLTNLQYYTVVAILYVSYCPAQVTHNFAGIVACRVFIGLPEAAFYPGAMYLLSRWYTRKELAFRSAILYSVLLLSNAFASIAAGKLGIAAWRWLFYIEGVITIFVGFQAMWLLPDYARLAEDAGEADQDSAEASLFEGFKMAIKDPKLLGLSFVNFFPTPPWIFASICTLIGAWHADRKGELFFHQTAWWWVVMVGYIISLSTMATAGGFTLTLTLVWVANAIPRPPAKRSVAMGLVNGFGNLGNGSYIWNANWSPQYHHDQSMIIAFLSLVIRWMLVRENKRMEREEMDLMHSPERQRIEEVAKLEGITFEEAIKRRQAFRYLH
ncbi:MFS general substrate transporter [Suillus placidus]|uniref:MFS general substrate transporter n=1 Tax=Suillus placidus TaxID=48579 RepID=A0A9P7A426_9AGAM|nr:MFS general substrate transporter [Suillus placidus]